MPHLVDMDVYTLKRRALPFAVLVILLILPRLSEAQKPDLSDYRKPASPPAPAFNPPTDAKTKLGEALFFDNRLSGANTISCATCHIPKFTWTDRRQFSLGETGEPRPRRTPPLQDVGWNQLFARDGRIETLEGFILGPISHSKEMNQNLDLLSEELTGIPLYPPLFRAAFGNTTITLDGITQSLASYVRSLRSSSSVFDAWVNGDNTALSGAAMAGFGLFTGKAGCVTCHSGWRFSDQKFHDIGLLTKDYGRAIITPGDPKMRHAFKTPSLRNVTVRPPYMHNGSLPSLSAVIDHYAGKFIVRPSLSPQVQPLDLTAQEKVNLIEFLKSLTDDNHLTEMLTFEN